MVDTKFLYHAVFKTEPVDDLDKFQPLPQASGSYPYRLNIEKGNELLHHKMVFHMVGDTGGIKSTELQKQIAAQMTDQYHAVMEEERPAFLYHLGDIVYHYGEAEQYDQQFLKPFEYYPGPIYAIAGNHDTDINPESETHYESLEAFLTTFCNTCSKTIYFGAQSNRKSQVQPNVYWTMETPLATIIGLHTNVPKYGHITNGQKSWFINELQHAARQNSKAIMVCMHHAPYSADINHGSSKPMIEFLTSSFEAAGVRPDIIFSGHVHNYQRFRQQDKDGRNLPFIVAGAGGFDELHQLACPLDPNYSTQSELFRNIHLMNYCDNRHGFLKISLEKTAFDFILKGAYYTVVPDQEAVLFDQFSVDLAHRMKM